jgi:hypothetical protein
MVFASTKSRPTLPRLHLAMLATIVLVTLIAALRPEWLLQLPIRSQMLSLFGLRCPFCGMTRDFVSIWHRQIPRLNPGSWAVAAFVYGFYPLLLGWAWIAHRPDPFQHPMLRRAIFFALALLWVANNLHR